MDEAEYIKMFSKIHNFKPYNSDAEIVKHGDGYELFSTDSFSEKEDFFENTPPEVIGHNMAMAAITDILACGVEPKYLLQSWSIDRAKSPEYYAQIATGIEEVLKKFGAKIIGGDIGCSAPWSWTATVVGYSSIAPITRQARERRAFKLYTSCSLGEANWAVFNKRPLPLISMPAKLPSEALFATDSSGGFFDAIENFRRVNQGLQLKIELDKVSSLSLLTLIGGIGEYALIYALPKDFAHDAIAIGEGHFVDNDGVIELFKAGIRVGEMGAPPPDYRNIDESEWLGATINYAKEISNYELDI